MEYPMQYIDEILALLFEQQEEIDFEELEATYHG